MAAKVWLWRRFWEQKLRLYMKKYNYSIRNLYITAFKNYKQFLNQSEVNLKSTMCKRKKKRKERKSHTSRKICYIIVLNLSIL